MLGKCFLLMPDVESALVGPLSFISGLGLSKHVLIY